jgi:hypothetical protein
MHADQPFRVGPLTAAYKSALIGMTLTSSSRTSVYYTGRYSDYLTWAMSPCRDDVRGVANAGYKEQPLAKIETQLLGVGL